MPILVYVFLSHFLILCYLFQCTSWQWKEKKRQREEIWVEQKRQEQQKKREKETENENLKQQISDIISLLIYLHTPDTLFFAAFLTVCVCNYHIAAKDLSLSCCVIFFPSSLFFSVSCSLFIFIVIRTLLPPIYSISIICCLFLSSTRFMVLCMRHDTQRVVIIRHLWNKLSKAKYQKRNETFWNAIQIFFSPLLCADSSLFLFALVQCSAVALYSMIVFNLQNSI